MNFSNIILLFFVITFIIEICGDFRQLKPYEVFGEEHKDTIVFVHGLSDDNHCWDKQIPIFSKYYRCIVVNRTYNKKYMYEEEFYDIVQKNKGSGKLYCVCASYGCVLSFNTQRKYKIFDKMIFMNFSWNPSYSYDWDMKCGMIGKITIHLYYSLICLSHYLPFLNILPLTIINMSLSCFVYSIGYVLELLINKRNIYVDGYIGLINTICFTNLQRQSHGYAYNKYFNEMQNTYKKLATHRPKPIQADIPVLSMIGEYDNICHINAPDVKERTEEQGATFVSIKSGGHWFMRTKPKEINKRIMDYLISY